MRGPQPALPSGGITSPPFVAPPNKGGWGGVGGRRGKVVKRMRYTDS